MPEYQFGNTFYCTKNEMLDAIIFEWLSADSMNGREDMLGLLAVSDKELTAECMHDWGLDQSERGVPSFMFQHGIAREDIEGAFAKLRANFDRALPAQEPET